MKNKKTIDNLFEQTKDLVIIGDRLSGEPEILHEIEDHFREKEFYPIVRDQIKRILECVPSVFPEDWKSPDSYDEFNSQQQKAYRDIRGLGVQACVGPVIQKTIELAVEYKNRSRAERN